MNKGDRTSKKTEITNLMFVFLIVAGIFVTTSVSGKTPDKRVMEIHNRILTVDTHCDTTMSLLD